MRFTPGLALIAGFCLSSAAQAAHADIAAASAQPFSTAITACGLRAYDQAISSDYMDGRKLAGSNAWPQWCRDNEFRARREQLMSKSRN